MIGKVRIVKEFNFEAAHALDGYHGKCKDIHGHSYKLTISVLGTPIQDNEEAECGMVMDFAHLKKIVGDHVLSIFDHYLILKDDSRFRASNIPNERIRYVKYQPTCENMLLEIVQIINTELPERVTLVKATLRETRSSYAEWRFEDNL